MNWRERLLDVGITLIFSGVLIRVFQPAVFDYVCYAISRRREKIKQQIEDMFATEIAQREAMAEMVNTHKDILEFIVESVKRTNEEVPQMVNVLNRVADTVETLNRTVERLNDGQNATQVALGRLEERTGMWERIHALDVQRMAGREPQRISDHLMDGA